MRSGSDCISCPLGKYQSGTGMVEDKACGVQPTGSDYSWTGMFWTNASSQTLASGATTKPGPEAKISGNRSSSNINTEMALHDGRSVAFQSSTSLSVEPIKVSAAPVSWSITATVTMDGAIPIESTAEFFLRASAIRFAIASSIKDALLTSMPPTAVANYSVEIIKLCYEGQCILFNHSSGSDLNNVRRSRSKSLTATFILVATSSMTNMTNHSVPQAAALAAIVIASGAFGLELSELMTKSAAINGLGVWNVNISSILGSDGVLAQGPTQSTSSSAQGPKYNGSTSDGAGPWVVDLKHGQTAFSMISMPVLFGTVSGAAALCSMCGAWCLVRKQRRRAKLEDAGPEPVRPDEKFPNPSVDPILSASKGEIGSEVVEFTARLDSNSDLEESLARSRDAGVTSTPKPVHCGQEHRKHGVQMQPALCIRRLRPLLTLPPLATIGHIPSWARNDPHWPETSLVRDNCTAFDPITGLETLGSTGNNAAGPIRAAAALQSLSPGLQPAARRFRPPTLRPLPPPPSFALMSGSGSGSHVDGADTAAARPIRLRQLQPIPSLALPPLSRLPPAVCTSPHGVPGVAPSAAVATSARSAQRRSGQSLPPPPPPPRPEGALGLTRPYFSSYRPLPLAPAMRQPWEGPGDAARGTAATGAAALPEHATATAAARRAVQRLPPLALPPHALTPLPRPRRPLPGAVDDGWPGGAAPP